MCNYTVLAICLRNEKLIDSTLRPLSSVKFDPTAKGFTALETEIEMLLSNPTYSVIAAFVYRKLQTAKNPSFKPEMPFQRRKYIVGEASASARRRARGGSVDSVSLRKVLGHKILKRRIEKPIRNTSSNNCTSSNCVYCSNH